MLYKDRDKSLMSGERSVFTSFKFPFEILPDTGGHQVIRPDKG